MSLFQNSVLNKYLKRLDSKKVDQAYEKFTNHFHNPTIQKNIRNSKEEQYQGEFLIDLFVNVLGYTKNPTPNFNLTTELKNIKGSKKTDGAILQDEKALAVIELKGTNTTDLGKVETQAFGYKNNHPGCNYVITSNFEKLRFYIDNAVDFEEFNLFQLSKERFQLLWLCLSADYLLKDLPKNIKEESLTQEENITKKLYKDYAAFRNEIFDDIQKENPAYDKLTLFKKTQKLLDRFLFIFFAEDRLLLPPNSIRSIVNQWTDLRDKYDQYVPLYDRFKKYFGYMNTGYKGHQHDIFAYNGGLFAPDEILDNIKINDEILHKHTVRLSDYDFESEVSVNILGHIFEHSLNDIDEIQAEIQSNEEADVANKQSKRKKDGVFYTPKYITKYIVDHTVGKLCEEKKQELDIQETEYEKDRKGRQKETLKKLSQKLDDYRNWLLQITICDPACGSGAFLNQALEFLITEHQYIDELQAKLYGDALLLSEIENSILEKNLYGVDINEESVEIAKLSLWLRTAQKGRKLTALNNNIKCGNSLIEDPSVAGDKAFHWETEFPEVFQEKQKEAYHVVLTTHNSRTSQRMKDYKVEKGPPIELGLEEEIALTEIMGQIIKENGYHCLAYNVCKDHVHMILVCEAEELTGIVQKIKSVSSKLFRRLDISMGHDPLEHKGFWSQKFFRVDLDVWSLGSLSNKPGYVYQSTHLGNAIEYIQNNREKHRLPASEKLEELIKDFVTDQDTAFATEYKGGFDVVIGNPPYVRKQGILEHYPEMCAFYEDNYQSATANYDIYALFMERSFDLINNQGIVSYILPHKFLVTDFGEGIRQFFKEKTAVERVLHFGSEMVFADASTYTCIINLDKTKKDKLYFKKIKPLDISNPFGWDYMLYEHLSEENWDLQSQKVFELIGKLKQQPFTVDDVFDRIFVGIQTGLDKFFSLELIENKVETGLFYSEIIDDIVEIEFQLVKPFIKGNQISKYRNLDNTLYALFPYEIIDNKAVPMLFSQIEKNYPLAASYFRMNEEFLKGREKRRFDNEEEWFLFSRKQGISGVEFPKIMTQEISLGCNMTYDEKGEFYHATTIYSFVKNDKFKVDDKFYLGILNSKVMWFFIKNTGTELRGGYFRFKTNYLKPFPLPEIPENPNLIIDQVNAILSLNKSLQKITDSFLSLLENKFFPGQDAPWGKKIQSWHELDFGTFLKELKKARKKAYKNMRKALEDPDHSKDNSSGSSKGSNPMGKLSLSEEAEWMEYFHEQKQKADALKAEIGQTDRAIDAMVYELYGLTDEEIEIVESST